MDQALPASEDLLESEDSAEWIAQIRLT